jgi:predicted CxxxxCH...CXXCH cytochrome family protein
MINREMQKLVRWNMDMSNKFRKAIPLLVMAFALGVALFDEADALQAPHDTTKSVDCSGCHPKPGFNTLTSIETFCYSNCHNPSATGSSAAVKKVISPLNPSNRFNNLPAGSYKQSSHGWDIPNTNPDAGATNNWSPRMPFRALYSKIYCSRCHRAHGSTADKPFLRDSKAGDKICFNCHAARDVQNVRDAKASGKHYSHPVKVSYEEAKAAKPDFFEASPTNPYPSNPTAALRLYTAAGKSDAVVCSTCHGPLHAADSNPYTYDNLSAYSRTGQYSTSAGNLLRRYDKSKDANNDLCKSCHKVTTHKGYNCYRCHTPHKREGENNRYLILEVISTPYNGKRPVLFTSTSEMAARFSAGYSTTESRFTRPVSNRICQVCHTGIDKPTLKYHKNYSSTTAKRDHHYLSGTKYKNCVGCHLHTAGFLPTGAAACGTCHKSPPDDAADGKHGKHTNESASYSWSDGTLNDERSAGSYGFSCGRCHNPYSPYTALKHYPAGYSDSVAAGYTTEYGFNIRSDQPLPKNPNGSYARAASGTSDEGANPGGSRFSWSNGTCRNLYCHGQFYNGYTGFNPTWQGTAACGTCHGATQELGRGLPGNMKNSTNWGAHPRHVGGGSQQYGTGTPNFRCNACHSTSATQNAISSVGLDRSVHVNGRINVKFDAAYDGGSATYNSMNNYTAQINTTITKPAYKTCGLIYCHSDGSRMTNFSAPFDLGNKQFPNWSSTRNYTTTVGGIKSRCVRCHGNSTYKGITASMPGYATRPGKGNAHLKHIQNGFLCYACHKDTVASDSRTITVANHVNKIYNVSMAAAYGGSWDGATKRCSNVKCHGQRPTPAWDSAARCQDCHFTSERSGLTSYTSEGRGYQDSYRFRNWTVQGSTPRIYSSEWVKFGHGRQADKYPNSNNNGANRICDDCHNAGVTHQTANSSNNPYRLDNADINALCQTCHASYKSHTKPDMDDWGDTTWAFNPKCVDCHDPHGDNNRFMVKRFVSFTTGSDGQGRVSGTNFVRQVTLTSVGGGQMNWSSYVKSDFSGICQRCHNNQENMKNFSKSIYKTDHFSGTRCTSCHQHTAGFKPKDCAGCHYFPPKDSRTPQANKMRHDRHVNWTSLPAQVAKNYDNTASNATDAIYNFACRKCHAGSHVNDTVDPRQVEVLFDSTNFPKNPSGLYARFSGWTETGASGTDEYTFMYSSGRCSDLYCHGNFAGGKTANAAKFDNSSTAAGADWTRIQRCGACHGASQSDPPTGGAHVKHVQTYSLGCRTCHRETNRFANYSVTDKRLHSDGKTSWMLYTTEARIGNAATYSNSVFGRVTTETASPTYSFCMNTYCHSKGSDITNPYNDAAALPNYTAKWGDNLTVKFANAGERCSYCHGSKAYKGITSAMPAQSGQAHKAHVVDSNLTRCYICHANVVDSSNGIVSAANHVNKFKNISIIMTYRTGGAVGYTDAGKTCANIKCHGGRTTPAWTATATCKDCHYSNAADVMDYTFRNFSVTASVPTIYSSEWGESGHGKTSGTYRVTGRSYAGKNCSTCHVSSKKHNDASNFFRLTGLGGGTDPSTLCMRCHGTPSQLQSGFGGGFGIATGLKAHTRAVLQAEGYTNLTTWRFTPKCTDCHDPHGDARATSGNIAMIRNTWLYNYSGSDSSGRPIRFPNLSTVMFTKYEGTTSFDDNVRKGRVCAVCHKRTAHNAFNHQGGSDKSGQDCRTCHKHKQGFNPSGCDGCHGYPPPPGPDVTWSDSMTNLSSTHYPHGKNPRGRVLNGDAPDGSWKCENCHNDTPGSGTNHNQGKTVADMTNMTTTAKKFKVKFTVGALKAPADDTCANSWCHTPRVYPRKWKKPADCDDCHGYKKGKGASERVFNLQTTGAHKVHTNWTGTTNLPATWKKNYNFACSECHYNWVTNNNYSTHYNGFVNITAGGPKNSIGGAFYGRGRSFKGFTTGGEYGTCTTAYCHGNFTGGQTPTPPNWKKGVTPMSCSSCHKGKADAATMPERHPKHASDYGFRCSGCHVRTVQSNYTVIFNYSSHVNFRKDSFFSQYTALEGATKITINNTGGTLSAARQCQNIYCHSRGTTTTPPFNTAATVANYTADWDHATPADRTGAGRGCAYCHGSKSYQGITAAMPDYANQAHAKHARNTAGDNFRCYVCHSNVVNSAGQIVSPTRHVNGFKNISVIKTYKTAQEGYSSTVAAKKTCKNIKCHGGRTTPLWTTGTAITCQDCHYTATDPLNNNNEVSYRFGQYSTTAARVYSSEWVTTGHGRTSGSNYRGSGTAGAGLTCRSCHRTAIAHNYSTASGGNFFRLTGIGSGRNINDVCLRCHGTTAPNKAGGGADKKANHHADTTTLKPKCIDCHDPHGDRNVYMGQRFVNWTAPSDSQGRPRSDSAGTPLATAVRLLVFTSSGAAQTGGPAAQWGDYRRADFRGICQTCHRSSTANFNKALDSTHNQGTGFSSRCAASCHKHTDKFVAGESSGGSACKACHAAIYNNMTSRKGARGINSYHHVMQSDSAARPYPNISAYQKNQVKDSSRTCLICHADHNVFSPDKNLRGTGNRAKNLRRDVFTTPTASDANSFARTDFWPAKRNASTRSDGSANYNQTYPSEIIGGWGICISCHKNVQWKNTSEQVNDGSTRAMPFAFETYTSSSHNFQVISGFNKVGTKEGQERSFRANCVKCHNDTLMKDKQPAAKDDRFRYGLHDSQRPALLNLTGDASGKIRAQDICYKCHSQDAKGSYDYYSSVKMSTTSKLIKTSITAKTSGHPVGENPGAHKTDEFYNATTATATYGWNRGANRHVECVDCHNTHGGNASITRKAGTPDGNKVAGAQIGVWGIQPVYSSGAWKSGSGGAPRYVKQRQIAYQHELCMKCHSGYAYFTGMPAIPSGGVSMRNDDGTKKTVFEIVPAVKQSDIARDFNPFNPGFHPVVAKGRNQPPHTANAAWPTRGTRAYYDHYTAAVGVNLVGHATWGPYVKFQGVSGLGWTFVPPWSQKSTLACSDCHQADNTGLAVGELEAHAVKAETTPHANWKTGYFDANNVWQQDAGFTASRLGASDRDYARITGTYANTDSFEVDVKWSQGAYPAGAISKRQVVAIGYGTESKALNRDIDWFVYKGTASQTLSAATVAFGTSNTRVTADITSSDGWATFDTGGDSTQNNADTSEHSVKINKDDTTGGLYINYVGIAITYQAAGDLRGPHGSLEKWLLQDLDKKVLFDADGDATNDITRDAVGGLAKDNPNADLTDTKNFCFNCHRRDVYGNEGETPTYPGYSRMSHPGGNAAHGEKAYNVWGINCMNCHGGRGSSAFRVTSSVKLIPRGGIHGVYGTRTFWAGNLGRPAGSFLVNNRPVGARLLYGATMIGAADNTNVSCYTLAAGDALGSCTAEAGKMLGGATPDTGNDGNTTTVNYPYTW